MIDPEVELDQLERTDLVMMYNSKGWQVFQNKIMLSIVEQFRVDLDNADPAKPNEVMAKHALSRAAGIVYTKILTRVVNEVMQNVESKKTDPQESAPGVDMDDIESATKDMPNLLGDVPFIAEDPEEGRL